MANATSAPEITALANSGHPQLDLMLGVSKVWLRNGHSADLWYVARFGKRHSNTLIRPLHDISDFCCLTSLLKFTLNLKIIFDHRDQDIYSEGSGSLKKKQLRSTFSSHSAHTSTRSSPHCLVVVIRSLDDDCTCCVRSAFISLTRVELWWRLFDFS